MWSPKRQSTNWASPERSTHHLTIWVGLTIPQPFVSRNERSFLSRLDNTTKTACTATLLQSIFVIFFWADLGSLIAKLFMMELKIHIASSGIHRKSSSSLHKRRLLQHYRYHQYSQLRLHQRSLQRHQINSLLHRQHYSVLMENSSQNFDLKGSLWRYCQTLTTGPKLHNRHKL